MSTIAWWRSPRHRVRIPRLLNKIAYIHMALVNGRICTHSHTQPHTATHWGAPWPASGSSSACAECLQRHEVQSQLQQSLKQHTWQGHQRRAYPHACQTSHALFPCKRSHASTCWWANRKASSNCSARRRSTTIFPSSWARCASPWFDAGVAAASSAVRDLSSCEAKQASRLDLGVPQLRTVTH